MLLLILPSTACGTELDEGDHSVPAREPDYCAAHPLECMSCFGVGTPIATPTGDRPIESLKPGDAVLAFDDLAGAVVVQTVTHVLHRRRPGLGSLVLDDGRRIAVTDNHPFYVEGRYAPVSSLALDQALLHLSADGALQHIGHHAFIPAADDHVDSVYDLSVSNTHNYFAAGVLVHNKSPWWPPPNRMQDCTSASWRELHADECGPVDGVLPTTPPEAWPCSTQADCPTGVCPCGGPTCLEYPCETHEECVEIARRRLGAGAPELALCVSGNCWFPRTLPLTVFACDEIDAGSADTDSGAGD